MALKIATVLQFTQYVGPLLKIVQKMGTDYLNFITIYLILLLMFSLVGNLNFVSSCSAFSTLFVSVMTIADASFGNFDFGIWEEVEDSFTQNIGKFYLLVTVILFAVLILNLIIAILSSTYNRFNPDSNGLFLSKILQTRV
jgi:hypothetical protein